MSAEQNNDPGRFRFLTAGFVKDLLAARVRTDPDFVVSPEMRKRWKLDADETKSYTTERLLRCSLERFGKICDWPIVWDTSCSDPPTDEEIVSDVYCHVKDFINREALDNAISAVKNGQPIDWENGFRWDELDAIRDLLDRLPHPSPAADANEAEVIPAESDTGHSPDFRSVRWFGQTFKFTPMQAACIKLLYENWLNGTPVIGEQTILESVDSSSNHLRDVFEKKRHPAWGPMLRPARKGTFRLAKPDES